MSKKKGRGRWGKRKTRPPSRKTKITQSKPKPKSKEKSKEKAKPEKPNLTVIDLQERRKLTGVDDPLPNDPPPMNPDAQKCLARRKWCPCGHRFVKDDLKLKLKLRMAPDFDPAKLGRCPDCGRVRVLCTKVAMKGKLVCRTHGGGGGRRPLDPLIDILDDERLDRVAALAKAKDDSLKREFYIIKTYIQDALGVQVPEDENGKPMINLETVERLTGLLDRAVGIQERHLRLTLQIPKGGDFTQLEFSDPRVALALKEKFRQLQEQTVRGTLQMIIQALKREGGGELMAQVLELLPERFQNYAAVSNAKQAEATVVDESENEKQEG